MKGQLSLETLYATFAAMVLIMVIISAFSGSFSDTVESANLTGKITYAWYESVSLSYQRNFYQGYSSLYYGSEQIGANCGYSPNQDIINNVTCKGTTVPMVYPRQDFFTKFGKYREVW